MIKGRCSLMETNDLLRIEDIRKMKILETYYENCRGIVQKKVADLFSRSYPLKNLQDVTFYM